MPRFVSIDVETANASYSSICQIGAVVFENGQETAHWDTLIDPRVEFRPFNTRIHGIRPEHVRGAPTFAQGLQLMQRAISQLDIVASYGHFDRSALRQACQHNGLPELSWQWIDVGLTARDVWPGEFGAGGWRLNMVCARLGIPLHKHHNALSDARAAGLVFARAQLDTNTIASDWLGNYGPQNKGRQAPPLSPLFEVPENARNALSGHRIVFTGSLSIPRGIAESMASDAGAEVVRSVSRRVTILVVGDQDLGLVGDDGKSTKQRRAEELIATGQSIAMLGEADFYKLIGRG